MNKLLLFFLLLVFFVGCKEQVSYVCSDGSVVDNPSACPPSEKEEAPISDVQVTPVDVFTLKKGESTYVSGKKVTLEEVFEDGRTVISVSGVVREMKGTKQLEIVNNLEIIVQSVNFIVTSPDSSTAVLSIKPLVLGSGEYLFFVDEPQKIGDVQLTLSGVTPSYIIVDTEETLGMKIYPKSSKIISGLNVTNIRAFPQGIRSEDYAILRAVKI